MVYYNPYITGEYNPLYALNNQFFFMAQMNFTREPGEGALLVHKMSLLSMHDTRTQDAQNATNRCAGNASFWKRLHIKMGSLTIKLKGFSWRSKWEKVIFSPIYSSQLHTSYSHRNGWACHWSATPLSSAAFSHRISTSPDRPISFTLPPFLRLDPIEDQYRLDTQKIATVWDGFYKDHDFLVYIVKLPGG